MRRVLRACLRVLHHPLWLLSPLVVMSVAFVANREWTHMYTWRLRLESYLFGANSLGDTWFPDVFSSSYYGFFAVHVGEDGSYSVVDTSSMIEKLNPEADSIRHSDGKFHVLSQRYGISLTGIPQGWFYWSSETVWVQADSHPFITDRGGREAIEAMRREYDIEQGVEPAEVAELVVDHAIRDAGARVSLAEYRDFCLRVCSQRLASDEVVEQRLLWPGALFEGASLLILATWPYSAVAMPFVMRRRYRVRHNLCLRCAYSLDGISDGLCPECGSATGVEELMRHRDTV
ncbi:MAG: hypothetical protein ACF8GE_05595 [Phycisphaerales bacterium JB043]